MLVTKDFSNTLHNYIDTWGYILSQATKDYYHRTLKTTAGQYLFGRDMIFNFVSIINWQIITTRKQRKVEKYNYKKPKKFRHDYSLYDIVYVDSPGIYCNMDYNKQGTYRITEV